MGPSNTINCCCTGNDPFQNQSTVVLKKTQLNTIQNFQGFRLAVDVFVSQEVSAELNSSMCELASKDIPTLVNFLSEASERQQKEIEAAPLEDRAELSERFWRASVRTADLLVSKPEPWLGLEENEVGEQVDRWQEQVDQAALTMGEHLDPDVTKLSSEGVGGLQLELLLIREEEKEDKVSFRGEGAQLILTHDKEEKQEKLVVFKSYRDLGCILNRQASCSDPPMVGEGRRVNSRVVGADLYLGEARTEVTHGLSVSILFEHTFGEEHVSKTYVGLPLSF